MYYASRLVAETEQDLQLLLNFYRQSAGITCQQTLSIKLKTLS